MITGSGDSSILLHITYSYTASSPFYQEELRVHLREDGNIYLIITHSHYLIVINFN